VTPLKIGLTGSIGMGKTTTARMFAEAGVPVWDADAAVHRLYAPGGDAVPEVARLFPEAVGPAGVDRDALKRRISENPEALRRIEAVVHPLVAADRARFVAEAEAKAVVLDIPLLFETGADREMDLTVTVTTDPETQRARVMRRPGMTEEQFAAMAAKQMPDAEKRARADMVIRTDDLDTARAGVEDVLRRIEERRVERRRSEGGPDA
jgi:dephospho-CoA kinase